MTGVRKSRFFLLFFPCLFYLCSWAGEPSFLGIEAICKAWEDNYGSIDSMDVAYKKYAVEVQGSEYHNFSGTVLYEEVDRREQQQKHRIEYSFGYGPDGLDSMNHIVQAFNGSTHVKYLFNGNSALIRSGLAGGSLDDLNEMSRTLLLSTRTHKGESLFLSNVRAGVMTGNLKIEPQLDVVSGTACHVIEISSRNELTYRIWVGHECGMLPMKQFWRSPDVEVTTTVETVETVETDRGILYYPASATIHYAYPREEAMLTSKLEVARFIPFARFDDSAFTVSIPDGTRIVDQIVGITYVKGMEQSDQFVPEQFSIIDINQTAETSSRPGLPGSSIGDDGNVVLGDGDGGEAMILPGTAEQSKRRLFNAPAMFLFFVALAGVGYFYCRLRGNDEKPEDRR